MYIDKIYINILSIRALMDGVELAVSSVQLMIPFKFNLPIVYIELL